MYISTRKIVRSVSGGERAHVANGKAVTKFPRELGELNSEIGDFEQVIKAFRRIRRIDKRVIGIKIMRGGMFL